jgi:hypothetical protein
VVLWLEGYHLYLDTKNTKWPERIVISQLKAITAGSILFTTSYYFSKNNLNKHALVQLSKVPIEYFNYVYVGTLLEPSSYTTNIANTARTVYIKGV